MTDPTPRHTYKLVFSFNGTNYYGWQRQPHEISIQETMEEVLRKLFRQDTLALTGCSRTDTGVHALEMTASFHSSTAMSSELLTLQLEKRLPHDIRILEAGETEPAFSAQSNFGKSYIYAVNLNHPTVFLRDATWFWRGTPDLQELERAIALLPGTHDFRNFTGRKDKTQTTIRTIYRAEMKQFGPVLCFYVSGDGFLYKMVRRIAGFLHEIAFGELLPENVQRALTDPDYPICELVAPPQGLYLKKVFYTPDAWESDHLETLPFLD